MDRIDTMKAFVTVAIEGSFTKAADKLGTSNQLVSKYVSQFEDYLGIRLFNRTTRKVRLTEAGEQCFQHANQILQSIQEMESHFGELQSVVKGRLHMSAPVSFSTLHLTPLIRDFKKKYPKVAIDLQLNDRQVDILEEGFDVALRIGYLKNSSLIAKKIAPVRLVFCASPEYLEQNGTPACPEDLIPEHFFRYSYMDGNQLNPVLMEVLGNSPKTASGLVANNGEVLMEAAIAGEGYVLQPTFIVGKALKQGKLKIILEDFEPEPLGLYAVYPHRQLLAPKLRAFLDFISGYYGQPPVWDDF